MRVLHFSDVHVGIPLLQVPLRKWFGKRAVGGANLLAARQRLFSDAVPKLQSLARFRRENAIDLVIFSGDYTALGLDREFKAARQAVQPLMDAPHGFVNVPGNHDLYVPDVVRERRFERHFGDTLQSDLPEARGAGPWPVVRLVGDDVAVVAVNSARPNRLIWRSSGEIPPRELDAFATVLGNPAVRERFVFIVTHYAARLRDGSPDRKLHGMINADDFLAVCAGLPRGAILCGHIHHRYHVRIEGVGPTLFCAGSATMDRREGIWVFETDGAAVRATPGSWTGHEYTLDRDSAIDV